jgi:uncharacterized protein YukJ
VNEYCMFKGKLQNAAPYKSEYVGSPHYVITLLGGDGKPFTLVVNSASTQAGPDGDNNVYFFADLHFTDPVTTKLATLAPGLYTQGFPKLDYFQDHSLLDLHRMRAIPYQDEEGNRADVNDIINDALTIDESQPSQSLPFDNGHDVHDRDFWTPTAPDVTVYGFGFLFQPKQDGLHETHMNQGNPRSGGHWNENGAFQDGAVIVERAGSFIGLFTAFQTQYLPTNALGQPDDNALALPDYIRS